MAPPAAPAAALLLGGAGALAGGSALGAALSGGVSHGAPRRRLGAPGAPQPPPRTTPGTGGRAPSAAVRLAGRAATPAIRSPLARRAAASRGAFGDGVPGEGLVKDLWQRRLFVSLAIGALLLAVWLLQLAGGLSSLHAFNAAQAPRDRLPDSAALEGWLFGSHPVRKLHGVRVDPTRSSLELDLMMDRPLLAQRGHLHRLLTGCLVHNGIFHIVFNLGYLYSLAPLEVGSPGAYLCTFLLAGIGGNLAFARFGAARRGLGASGAVCGLMGFELVCRLRNRQVREFRTVMRQAFGILVLGAFLPGVGNWAHAGGLATGAMVALLTARRSGFRTALVPWPVLLLGLALTPFGRRFVRALASALALAAARPGALGAGAPLR